MTNETRASWDEVIRICGALKNGVGQARNELEDGIVLFGSGPYGQAAFRYLKKMGAKVLCFADNDLAKQGTAMDGVPVVAPENAAVLSASLVLITARHAGIPVSAQLSALGVKSLLFDAFFVARNLDRISNVRNKLLHDDRSRLCYDGILKTMLTGNKSFCAAIMEGNQYFAVPQSGDSGEHHFVDAGAYVGDTLERFLWAHNGVFARIYAFEPGEPQFGALKHRVSRLCREWAVPETKILCEHAGLAEEDGELCVSTHHPLLQSASCHGGAGAVKARARSLDSYLAGQPATFIKADVEGMEMAMLRGAKSTIRKCKPKMALCIYHEPEDLFEIAEYVNSLEPGYQMAFRHHSPVLMESVLYCWIDQ